VRRAVGIAGPPPPQHLEVRAVGVGGAEAVDDGDRPPLQPFEGAVQHDVVARPQERRLVELVAAVVGEPGGVGRRRHRQAVVAAGHLDDDQQARRQVAGRRDRGRRAGPPRSADRPGTAGDRARPDRRGEDAGAEPGEGEEVAAADVLGHGSISRNGGVRRRRLRGW